MRRNHTSATGIGLVLASSLAPSAYCAEEPAVMFHANPARTGVYPEGGPANPGTLLWKFKTAKQFEASPAVAGGMVYFGSNDGIFHAVDLKDGVEKWKIETGRNLESSPAIQDGVVYFGCHDQFLHAVDAKHGDFIYED